MSQSRLSDIKKNQKESLFLKEISKLFYQAALDDKKLQELYISRVQLSKDKGICFVFFFSPKGEADFNEKLHDLKLYKPSLRKAIASTIKGRYAPEIVFRYDNEFEKQSKLEELLDKIKEKDAELNSKQ